MAFFYIKLVSADLTCSISTTSNCSESNIILLRLQNDTGGYENSHAQLANYSGTSYNNTLCCSSTNNPNLNNTCSASFTSFLRLSNNTNAHAQNSSNSTYNYPACISVPATNSNPICGTFQDNCSATYTCILSMASSFDNNSTNAHFGSCDKYQTKLCCFVNSPTTTTTSNGGRTSIGGVSGSSSNVITETKDLGVISKDESKEVKFNENKIVDGITLTALENSNNIEIELKKYDMVPEVPALDNEYSYLKIELKNINEFKAKINFKVEKSWFVNKNLDKGSVILQRFENGWNKLPTARVREDSSNIYYEAETSKFSYFAINAEPVKIEEKLKEVNKTNNIIKKITEPFITKEDIKSYPLFFIILIIITALVMLYKIRNSVKNIGRTTKETKVRMLKDYVKIYRLRGYSKEKIKDIAIKKGWDEDLVNDVLNDIK